MSTKKKVQQAKRIRLAAAFIGAAIVCFWQWRNPSWFSSGVILTIELQVNRSNTFLLVTDGRHQGKTLTASKIPIKMIFPINSTPSRELKLTLGHDPDLIIIRKITIRGLLSSRSWTGTSLAALISSMSGVIENTCKVYGTQLHSLGEDRAFVLFSPRLFPVLDRLRSVGFLRGLSSILTALLVFLAILALSPGAAWQRRKTCLGFLPCLFLTLIFLPLLDEITGFSECWPLQENRTLSKKPVLTLTDLGQFPQAYQRYYNDHFGFRSILIQTFNRFKVAAFRISANPYTMLGLDGWLYQDRESDNRDVIDYQLGRYPFDSQELQRWVNVLQQRRDWLKRQNCDYLFVIAPDKASIYPEFLPNRIRTHLKPNRLDQLAKTLQGMDDPFLLDLRPAFREAKRLGLTYQKTDTHWNDLGGYVAYREIIRRLSHRFPRLTPLPLGRFRREVVQKPGGDLAVLLAMSDHFRDVYTTLIPLQPRKSSKINLPPFPRELVTWSGSEFPDPKLPRAVMLRDSYAHQLLDLMSESFSRIVFVWDHAKRFYPEIVRQERPQILIEEMGERFLVGMNPSNPPELDH